MKTILLFLLLTVGAANAQMFRFWRHTSTNGQPLSMSQDPCYLTFSGLPVGGVVSDIVITTTANIPTITFDTFRQTYGGTGSSREYYYKTSVNWTAAQPGSTVYSNSPCTRTLKWKVTANGVTNSYTYTQSGNYDCYVTGQYSTAYVSSWGTVPLPAPDVKLGKITVNADALAAGSSSTRSYSIGTGPRVPVLLVQGLNVILDTDKPENYSGEVKIWQAPDTVIGSGTIVKDSSGNFNLAIQAVGRPVIARTTINATEEVVGKGRWWFHGWGDSTAEPFDFVGAATAHVSEWGNPFQIADGTKIYVDFEVVQTKTVGAEAVEERTWKRVGEGQVIKDEVGGWNVAILCTGDGKPPTTGGASDAVFTLDALVYDTGAKKVQLRIDGQVYDATPSAMTGDAKDGLRQVYTVILPNGQAQLHGRTYEWIVTGMHQGQPVRQMVVANGTTPIYVGAVDDAGNPVGDTRLDYNNGVTLGAPEDSADPNPPPVPPNEYDPHEPIDPEDPEAQAKEEKKSNYEAVRAAVSDAFGLPEFVATPGTADADAEAAAMIKSQEKFINSIVGLTKLVTVPAAAPTLTYSPILSFTLPIVGTWTIDMGTFGTLPGKIRGILLGLLGFLVLVFVTRMLSKLFA